MKILFIFSFNFLKGINTMKKESKFQSELIKELEQKIPDCMILKNDPSYKQGVPDLLILSGKKWAMLECKQKENSKHRPNQDYYVSKLSRMSFASFIYPENKNEVVKNLVHFLGGKK